MFAGQTWVVPLGNAGYDAAHALQRLVFNAKVAARRAARRRVREGVAPKDEPPVVLDPVPDIIFTVEHAESCFTMGVRDTSAGVIDPTLRAMLPAPPPHDIGVTSCSTPREWAAALRQCDASATLVRKISRGGGVTWHGPGQVTMYPIVSIKEAFARQPEELRAPFKGSVMHWWAHLLEETMIDVVVDTGEMLAPNLEAPCASRAHSGVWVGGEKIGFVGTHATDFVTMHGLSFNVSEAVEKEFSRVVMCELPGKRATSYERVFRELEGVEGGGLLKGQRFHTPSLDRVQSMLAQRLCRHLQGTGNQTVVGFTDTASGVEAVLDAVRAAQE